jgi:serine/threonine protein kinase
MALDDTTRVPVEWPGSLPIGTHVGHYRIESVLGQGGFGITYAAVHVELDRRVAIKELFPRDHVVRASDGVSVVPVSDQVEALNDIIANFEKEARLIAARFHHPNVVEGENFVRAHNTVYAVMRFIEGDTLKTWRKKKEELPSEKEIKDIFSQILDGVKYLHENDYMHRDIKPDNIIIRPDGRAVIIDLGQSGMGFGRERYTTQMATASYAAPEQLIDAKELTGSFVQGRYTDIFALGATLYFAITGRAPQPNALVRIFEVRKRLVGRDPLVPLKNEQTQGLYSDRLLTGVERALQLDYEDRPQSIDDFRALLGWSADDAADDAPTTRVESASPPRSSGRKTVLAAGVAVLVTAVASLAAGMLVNEKAKCWTSPSAKAAATGTEFAPLLNQALAFQGCDAGKDAYDRLSAYMNELGTRETDLKTREAALASREAR